MGIVIARNMGFGFIKVAEKARGCDTKLSNPQSFLQSQFLLAFQHWLSLITDFKFYVNKLLPSQVVYVSAFIIARARKSGEHKAIIIGDRV